MIKKYSFHIIISWVIILTILYSELSIIRHNNFQSGGFDLGLYDQAVWQYAHFQWPYNTIKDRFILGDHLTLTLPLLSPLYWLWDNVRILFIFQAFWVSLSTIAIYKLARLRNFSEGSALCVSVIYSLFYGIQFLIFFDFHPVSIGMGLLPWIAYFLESKRKRLLVASVILLLLTQENMGIALMGLGFIYFFRKPFRRTSIIFILTGIIWSFIAMKIISYFSPSGFQYAPQISHNPMTIITNFFDAPEKQQVWLYTLASFSFLPIFSLGAMLAVTLDLAQYFVTGPEFSRMWNPFMHHRVILGVFLALGALDVLERLPKLVIPAYAGIHHLKSWIPDSPRFGEAGQVGNDRHTKRNQPKEIIITELIAFILLISTLFQQFYFHLPLNKLTKSEYWKQEQWMKDDRALIALVPAGASVATQQNLVPHLSHRKEIYLVFPREHDFLIPVIPAHEPESIGKNVWIPGQARDDNPSNIISPCGKRSCWWLDFPGKPQYLVVDLRPDQWLTQILETNEHFDEAVKNMEKAEKITLVTSVHDARLYTINY